MSVLLVYTYVARSGSESAVMDSLRRRSVNCALYTLYRYEEQAVFPR
jgi:hypothetical protein